MPKRPITFLSSLCFLHWYACLKSATRRSELCWFFAFSLSFRSRFKVFRWSFYLLPLASPVELIFFKFDSFTTCRLAKRISIYLWHDVVPLFFYAPEFFSLLKYCNVFSLNFIFSVFYWIIFNFKLTFAANCEYVLERETIKGLFFFTFDE